MPSSAFLTLMLALLAATTGADEDESELLINKCCLPYKMLSSDGESCVDAAWPGNFSVQRDSDFCLPPLDMAWVRRWLAPGLLLQRSSVLMDSRVRSHPFLVARVTASSLRNGSPLRSQDVPSDAFVALTSGVFAARPKPGGGFRLADYCVDGAPPPLGPFAMRFATRCGAEECARKCCRYGKLLKGEDGRWMCGEDPRGVWTPGKSSLAAFDPEMPFEDFSSCLHHRRLPFEDKYAVWASRARSIHQFHFSTWTTCFDFYRSSNGSVKEGVFYCDYPRATRGVYWLLRPLCCLSALLLMVSLLSVACNKSMRRKIHGRCLASHAACLFAFNIGQIWYYLSISDRLDEEEKYLIPPDLQSVCQYVALPMYFVLTAAWFWLTALCANMARGFRLHLTRLNTGCGKKFLAISAFAWGLPAVLTIACSILFTQPNGTKTPAWYIPSLMETRVCYVEPLFYSEDNDSSLRVPFMKSGTALFYYGPVCCLVMCNIVCLAMTLRKVQYLQRGNSVLRREEDQIPRGQRHTEGNNPPTPHTATGNGQTRGSRNRSGTTIDAKTIKLYIKMILISGGIEMFTEVIIWLTTHDNASLGEKYFSLWTVASRKDRDLAYRAAGYVTDFFRAAVVTWLAAPEGGYLALMRRLHRNKTETKSTGKGNPTSAGRT